MTAYKHSKQPASELDDSDLVSRARQGDRDAFAELTRLFLPQLLRTALRLVRDRADAEDVVQMALSSAFQHIAAYRGQASFRTWLTRITINEGLQFRGKKSRDLAFIRHQSWHDHYRWRRSPQPDPEQCCLINEMQGFFQKALKAIDPAYAKILSMRVLDELKYGEIAELQGLPVSSVKTRIHRARRMLQKLDAEFRPCC